MNNRSMSLNFFPGKSVEEKQISVDVKLDFDSNKMYFQSIATDLGNNITDPSTILTNLCEIPKKRNQELANDYWHKRLGKYLINTPDPNGYVSAFMSFFPNHKNLIPQELQNKFKTWTIPELLLHVLDEQKIQQIALTDDINLLEDVILQFSDKGRSLIYALCSQLQNKDSSFKASKSLSHLKNVIKQLSEKDMKMVIAGLCKNLMTSSDSASGALIELIDVFAKLDENFQRVIINILHDIMQDTRDYYAWNHTAKVLQQFSFICSMPVELIEATFEVLRKEIQKSDCLGHRNGIQAIGFLKNMMLSLPDKGASLIEELCQLLAKTDNGHTKTEIAETLGLLAEEILICNKVERVLSVITSNIKYLKDFNRATRQSPAEQMSLISKLIIQHPRPGVSLILTVFEWNCLIGIELLSKWQHIIIQFGNQWYPLINDYIQHLQKLSLLHEDKAHNQDLRSLYSPKILESLSNVILQSPDNGQALIKLLLSGMQSTNPYCRLHAAEALGYLSNVIAELPDAGKSVITELCEQNCPKFTWLTPATEINEACMRSLAKLKPVLAKNPEWSNKVLNYLANQNSWSAALTICQLSDFFRYLPDQGEAILKTVVSGAKCSNYHYTCHDFLPPGTPFYIIEGRIFHKETLLKMAKTASLDFFGKLDYGNRFSKEYKHTEDRCKILYEIANFESLDQQKKLMWIIIFEQYLEKFNKANLTDHYRELSKIMGKMYTDYCRKELLTNCIKVKNLVKIVDEYQAETTIFSNNP